MFLYTLLFLLLFFCYFKLFFIFLLFMMFLPLSVFVFFYFVSLFTLCFLLLLFVFDVAFPNKNKSPNVEANIYDCNGLNVKKKSSLRLCIHLPMKNMYSIAISIAPVNNKHETQSNVEANTYDFEKNILKPKVVTTMLPMENCTICFRS